jgi:hypothetical protein
MSIKEITGCELVIEGSALKLKLTYRNVAVYGIVGSTGEHECSIGLCQGECTEL